MGEKYDSIRFDLLKEVNNIGTGNALTSLSILMNEKISMHVPKIVFVDFKDLATIVGGVDKKVIGVLSRLSGDIEGIIMFVLDFQAADFLVSALLNKDYSKDSSDVVFDDMEFSVITEIGNIMFGSYSSSLNKLTNKSVISSVPYLSVDMAGAVLSVPAIEFSKISDKVIVVGSVFVLNEIEITGNLIMVPDAKSFDVIVGSLGLEV